MSESWTISGVWDNFFKVLAGSPDFEYVLIDAAIPMDKEIYKERHLIECFFIKIKRFRRVALRCEKTISSFRAFVAIAWAMVWLRQMQTLQRFAFNLDHCITLTAEAELAKQTRSVVKVMHIKRETL